MARPGRGQPLSTQIFLSALGDADVTLSGTDTGAGADVAAVAATLPTSTDTGTGADASAVANAVSGTDTGAGVDASSAGITISTSDAGTGASASSVAAAISASDTGTDTETALAGTTPIAGADAGVGTDSVLTLTRPSVPGVISGLPWPRLYVEILSNSTSDFGPVDARGNHNQDAKARRVLHDAVSVGFSRYSRFPSSCFFTLPKGSVNAVDLNPGLDHVRIWYANPITGYGPVLVFAGRLGDPSESGDDDVWTGWSYLAELALSRTGYSTMYKHQKISDIVDQEWRGSQSPKTGTAKYPIAGDSGYGAKVRTDSLLAHISTGTIQNPVNSTGSIDVKTDAQFGVIDVPRLLLMFDLTEMGRANTTQNVVMEITHALDPHFNFWKDKGTALTTRRFMFPGNVADFRLTPGVMAIRNDLATIGVKGSKATEIVNWIKTGAYGSAMFGRRQDTLTIKTLAGFANIDDESTGKFKAQTQITASAAKQASQLTRALVLDIEPGEFEPFDGYDIEDTMIVELKRGRTNLNQRMRIVGIRGQMDQNGYNQSLLVTLPTT